MVKNSKKGNFKLFNVIEKCRVKIKAIFSNFRFVMNKTVKYLENFITNLSTDSIKLLLIEAVKMTNVIVKCTYTRLNRTIGSMPTRQK